MKTRESRERVERRKNNKDTLSKWLRYFEKDLHADINTLRKELKEEGV